MIIDLVVSHYAADLAWLKPLRRPGLNVFVYTKGEAPCGVPAFRLPNVGKCDHTYLHHIVEHYGELADWTLFCPDYPFDHLGDMTLEEGLTPAGELKVPWVCTVKDWRTNPQRAGRIAWEEFMFRTDRNGTSYKARFESGKIQKAELDFLTWSKQFVDHDPSNGWPGYAPGGILGVPRKAITYLPAAFYARLRDQLAGSAEPEEGHYLERLWVAIFSGRAAYHEPKKEANHERETTDGREGNRVAVRQNGN